MNRSADAGQTSIEKRYRRYPPGIIWLTTEALEALHVCPNYPHALVTYIAAMEASAPRFGGPDCTSTTPNALCPDLTEQETEAALDVLTDIGLLFRVVTQDGTTYALENFPKEPEPDTARPPEREAPDRGPCVYCGEPSSVRDHVLAKSKGGRRKGNLVPACGPCNGSKGARDVREWVKRKGLDWPTIEARILAHGVTL